MKKFFILLLLFAGSSTLLLAEKISKYDTSITVKQDGRLNITESIEYDFQGASRHGIFRDIPFTVKNSGFPKDLGIDHFSVKMDGKDVEWQTVILSNTDSGEMIRIRIGSPDIKITGIHTYTIGYQVQKGVLPSSIDSSHDAVRWNVIGTGWEIPIENITSDFYLPPSLSQNNIEIKSFQGTYGSKKEAGAALWIDAHHFQHKVNSLAPHEGVTIEASYPEGILDLKGRDVMANTLSEEIIVGWHWPVFAGFLLYLWFYLRRYTGVSDKRSIAVQYNLPKDMDILQAGLIYDKFTDDADFSAALLELAQKGYMEITQKRTIDHPLLKKTAKSTKDLSEDLKYLMDEILFYKKSSYRLKRSSSTESARVKDGFDKINEMLYLWSVKEGYMRENPKNIRKTFIKTSLLLMLPITLFALYSTFVTSGIEMIILPLFASIFIGVGLSVAIQKGVFVKIFGSVFILGGMIPLSILLLNGGSISTFLGSSLMVVILLFVAIYFVYRDLGAYTQKGASSYKQILGLKEFMTRVKADEIRRRLKDDPLYMEKTLPYALLFGLSDHWLELFDTLEVSHPLWYHGSLHNIGGLSSSMNSASTQPPSSSSGGSSGGGGFSGGGGGGGGGGSW
ncbi:MAG: DUF2207 domain-containing protein [Campylobacterota bacterium]|nr:DUF2207 domain-containing protein [Campylobacterota bacterium]